LLVDEAVSTCPSKKEKTDPWRENNIKRKRRVRRVIIEGKE
jgi:hypothetical protein